MKNSIQYNFSELREPSEQQSEKHSHDVAEQLSRIGAVMSRRCQTSVHLHKFSSVRDCDSKTDTNVRGGHNIQSQEIEFSTFCQRYVLWKI